MAVDSGEWSDATKEKAIVDFLNWMVDKGQSMTASLDYAPLPKAVATKVKAKIHEIHVKGKESAKERPSPKNQPKPRPKLRPRPGDRVQRLEIEIPATKEFLVAGIFMCPA